jgi:hypothetical protein
LKGGVYMPKTKGKNLPPVRVEESLYDQTVKCAAEADEYLSVYIRKAIEYRNAQLKPIENKPVTQEDIDRAREALRKVNERNEENRKPSNIGLDTKEIKYISEDKPKAKKPTIPELKEKVKEMERPKMVQSFMKK